MSEHLTEREQRDHHDDDVDAVEQRIDTERQAGLTRLCVDTDPTTTLIYGDRWQAVLREHEELLGPIEARDGEAARRIAEHHMFGAREVRLRMYAETSEHTTDIG